MGRTVAFVSLLMAPSLARLPCSRGPTAYRNVAPGQSAQLTPHCMPQIDSASTCFVQAPLLQPLPRGRNVAANDELRSATPPPSSLTPPPPASPPPPRTTSLHRRHTRTVARSGPRPHQSGTGAPPPTPRSAHPECPAE